MALTRVARTARKVARESRRKSVSSTSYGRRKVPLSRKGKSVANGKRELRGMTEAEKVDLLKRTEARNQVIGAKRSHRGRRAKQEDIVRKHYRPQKKETYKGGHRSARHPNMVLSDQFVKAAPGILRREGRNAESIVRAESKLPYLKRRKAAKIRGKQRVKDELRHMKQERAYWNSHSDNGFAYKSKNYLTPAQQRNFANKTAAGVLGGGGAVVLSEALKKRKKERK
jgi:hypothetical protein